PRPSTEMKDSNQRLLLTVVLCMAVALVWSLVFQPKPQPRSTPPPTAAQPAPPVPVPPPSSAPAKESPATAGSGAARGTPAPRPPARTVTLDSEKLRVLVTSEGAAVQSMQLKGEKF